LDLLKDAVMQALSFLSAILSGLLSAHPSLSLWAILWAIPSAQS
jgi:hypothetical protein